MVCREAGRRGRKEVVAGEPMFTSKSRWGRADLALQHGKRQEQGQKKQKPKDKQVQAETKTVEPKDEPMEDSAAEEASPKYKHPSKQSRARPQRKLELKVQTEVEVKEELPSDPESEEEVKDELASDTESEESSLDSESEEQVKEELPSETEREEEVQSRRRKLQQLRKGWKDAEVKVGEEEDRAELQAVGKENNDDIDDDAGRCKSSRGKSRRCSRPLYRDGWCACHSKGRKRPKLQQQRKRWNDATGKVEEDSAKPKAVGKERSDNVDDDGGGCRRSDGKKWRCSRPLYRDGWCTYHFEYYEAKRLKIALPPPPKRQKKAKTYHFEAKKLKLPLLPAPKGQKKTKTQTRKRSREEFHVSLLRRYQEPDDSSSIRPPPIILPDAEEEYEVDHLLEVRTKLFRGRMELEYLVRWKGYPVEEATWEAEPNLANARDLVEEFHVKRRERELIINMLRAKPGKRKLKGKSYNQKVTAKKRKAASNPL